MNTAKESLNYHSDKHYTLDLRQFGKPFSVNSVSPTVVSVSEKKKIDPQNQGAISGKKS